MLDRPAPDATPSGPAERIQHSQSSQSSQPPQVSQAPQAPQAFQPRWPLAFVGLSGILGACGVVVGAAGAHVGGGDLARTSSEFLMVHAAAVLGGSAAALALGGAGVPRRTALLGLAMGLLTLGAALFGGELAFAALLDWRPVPLAAPTGGLCLIAGWLCLSLSAALLAARRR